MSGGIIVGTVSQFFPVRIDEWLTVQWKAGAWFFPTADRAANKIKRSGRCILSSFVFLLQIALFILLAKIFSSPAWLVQFELKCQVDASCSSIQKIFIRSLARSFPLSELLVTCFVSCPSEKERSEREDMKQKKAEILVLFGETTKLASWSRMKQFTKVDIGRLNCDETESGWGKKLKREPDR